MKRPVLIAALIFAVLVPAARAVDREVIQIQQSVALLQGMVREIQRSFDEKMAIMQSTIEQSADQTARLGSDLEQLQQSLQVTVGGSGLKMEVLSTQVQGLQSSLDDLRARLDLMSQQLAKIEAGSQNLMSGGMGMMGEGGGVTPPSPDVLYNTALRDYTSGNYPLALQEFTDYLRYYADTPLASNSQFYAGDIYYQQGQFEKAIQEYDKAIEQYPNGNKSAAAQLKKGYALINLNLRTQGARELSSLLQRFPNTPEARLAEDKLSTLRIEPETAR
jgi:tol-pal system protein YbgF